MNKSTDAYNRGYSASLYQIRYAYQMTFHEDLPKGMTYVEASQLLRHKLGGFGRAKELLQSIPNDPTLPYPLEVK